MKISARRRQLSKMGMPLNWFLCAVVAVMFLMPHKAEAWWNGDWSYRKKITIDGGPKGANLGGDLGRVPILVRLHDGNFKFTDAKPDGSDIRFIDADDKTPLKFHIETYDNLLDIALVWVDLPALRAGGTADIWLYYGNTNAPEAADPRGTYDDSTALVYHFAEKGAPPRDETANANNATLPVKSIDNALIGRGVHFDGTNVLALPVSPSLAVPQGGNLTWSAWIKPDGPGNGIVYAKHDGANAFIIGLDQGKPYVSVVVNGAQTTATSPQALAPAGWHQIAVVASDQVRLYVDGKSLAALAASMPALNQAATLGGDTANVLQKSVPVGAASNYVGDLDELEISRTARSQPFLQAEFANQGPNGQMLAYGEDEENAGWSGGYFGVILRSVTIDGWVVISILGVMAAISFLVMYSKARYVGRVAKADKQFLVMFDRAGSDFTRLQSLLETEARGMGHSVLFKVCEAGAAEISRRMRGSARFTLSAPAIATIRATLDRVSTYEARDLNSLMVLLTIAISGGPFLGLLGTVVGVMITFAAIAQTGDVNINAIAPGIAAALVATVAGLAVAIPSLFGYNYLISRIKDITTEMHVFIDEFVTRLAEAFPEGAEATSRAAE